MTRYLPSRRYVWAGLVALGLAAFSGWFAMSWVFAFIPVVLFLLSAALLVFLSLQPPIEIRENHLAIGNRTVPWTSIRRVDRIPWTSPLVVCLTLADGKRVLLIYPGNLDSSNSLLRHLRRRSREALIDGIPYRQFWGEAVSASPDRKQLPSPRYRLLRPEDEAEIERLYQRLKTVRHLDADNSSDEK